MKAENEQDEMRVRRIPHRCYRNNLDDEELLLFRRINTRVIDSIAGTIPSNLKELNTTFRRSNRPRLLTLKAAND